jgi:bacteriorhodopsin
MNLKKILHGTVYASLFVQILTAIIDIYALQKPVSSESRILKKLLKVEILVQFVEGIFYLHFANNINTITNATPIRYYDWVITTPTMLYA